MTIFKKISENEATGKVKEIFDEIKEARQITEIPNFWKTMANSPETLERTWRSLQQVMGKGELDPAVKELIYVAVSITNNCCLLYTSPSPRDRQKSRMPSSA